LPIVSRHLIGLTLATAETLLSDPPGLFFAAMTAKRILRNSASEEGLGTALSRRTSGLELHHLVSRPDSSGGRGGRAGVEAQVGATRNETATQFLSEGVASSKGLAMNLNGRGRFDNESPNEGAGELDVPRPRRVQAPVTGVGNDDEEINLAYLSFSSDTVYLAKNACHS
jgi:hypothetical protein